MRFVQVLLTRYGMHLAYIAIAAAFAVGVKVELNDSRMLNLERRAELRDVKDTAILQSIHDLDVNVARIGQKVDDLHDWQFRRQQTARAGD